MLINTQKLKGKIAEKSFTQKDLSRVLGMSPRTFYSKMKSGDFGVDDVTKLGAALALSREELLDIFFPRW